MNKGHTEDFQGSATTLYDAIIVDASFETFAKIHRCTTQSVNSNTNCVLQLIIIIMHQYCFIKCNQYITQMQIVNCGEIEKGRGEEVYGHSEIPAQLLCCWIGNCCLAIQ